MKRIGFHRRFTALAAGLSLILALVEPVSVLSVVFASASLAAQTKIVPGAVVIRGSLFYSYAQVVVEVEDDKALVVQHTPFRAKFESVEELSNSEVLKPKSTDIDSLLIPVFEEQGNPRSRVLRLEAHRVSAEVMTTRGLRYVITTAGRMIHFGFHITGDNLVVQPAVPVTKGESYSGAIDRYNAKNADSRGFQAMDPHVQIDIRPLNAALNVEALKHWARQGFEIKEVAKTEPPPSAKVLDFAAFAARRKCSNNVVATPEAPTED